MRGRVSGPIFTFRPFWVADLSLWGPPQSIFFHGLEDSYARFNPGQKVATGAMFGVWRGVDRGRCGSWARHRRGSRVMDWRRSGECVRRPATQKGQLASLHMTLSPLFTDDSEALLSHGA